MTNVPTLAELKKQMNAGDISIAILKADWGLMRASLEGMELRIGEFQDKQDSLRTQLNMYLAELERSKPLEPKETP